MADFGGHGDPGAVYGGQPVVEGPGAGGAEAQIHLQIGGGEREFRGEGPGENTVADDEAIHLDFAVEQGGEIHAHLDFAGGQAGAVRDAGLADADIFGDDAADQAQTQPGIFEVHALIPQRGHEPGFEEVRQADPVEPEEGA